MARLLCAALLTLSPAAQSLSQSHRAITADSRSAVDETDAAPNKANPATRKLAKGRKPARHPQFRKVIKQFTRSSRRFDSALQLRKERLQVKSAQTASANAVQSKEVAVLSLGQRGSVLVNRTDRASATLNVDHENGTYVSSNGTNMDGRPQQISHFKNFATLEDSSNLKQWCEKVAYAIDYEHAAYKFTNATLSNTTTSANRTSYYHLHTPKVAGVSFGGDLAEALPQGVTVDSHEGCFDDNLNALHGVLMMVRSPRAHVFSQYNFCATSPDAGPSHMHELMPGSFENWIRNWTALQQDGKAHGNFTIGPKTAYNDPWCFSTLPYACYSPIDLQTQRLTCGAGKAYDYPREQDQDLALANMGKAFFVGVVEAYQESICLLHAKLSNKLPTWCDCMNEEQWKKAPIHQDDHGASHSGLDDIPEDVLRMVDNMTNSDREVYNQALDRFMMEIDAVEKKFNTTIVCEHNFFMDMPQAMATDEESLANIDDIYIA